MCGYPETGKRVETGKFHPKALQFKKNNNFVRWRKSGLLHQRTDMKKSLYSFLLFAVCFWGMAYAGTTPGQETGLMKRNQKRNHIQTNPMEEASSPIANQAEPKATESLAAVNSAANKTSASASGASLSGKAARNQVKMSQTKSGKDLGRFSLRNIWQAGKFLKSHQKNGFIQISITVFLFVVILLLIGMMLGVILNNLFILFYIALALLLLWVLIFMLGNLGIKRR